MDKVHIVSELYNAYISKQDKKSLDSLVLFLQPFIGSVVNKVSKKFPFFYKYFERKDLMNIGNVIILTALPKYESNRGTSLTTFLHKVLFNEFAKTISYVNGYKRTDALNFNTRRDVEAHVLEMLHVDPTTPEALVLDKNITTIQRALIEGVLSSLTKRQRSIIRLGRLQDDFDIDEHGGQRQLAQRLGTSYQAVHSLDSRTLKIMGELLRKRGHSARSVLG